MDYHTVPKIWGGIFQQELDEVVLDADDIPKINLKPYRYHNIVMSRRDQAQFAAVNPGWEMIVCECDTRKVAHIHAVSANFFSQTELIPGVQLAPPLFLAENFVGEYTLTPKPTSATVLADSTLDFRNRNIAAANQSPLPAGWPRRTPTLAPSRMAGLPLPTPKNSAEAPARGDAAPSSDDDATSQASTALFPPEAEKDDDDASTYDTDRVVFSNSVAAYECVIRTGSLTHLKTIIANASSVKWRTLDTCTTNSAKRTLRQNLNTSFTKQLAEAFDSQFNLVQLLTKLERSVKTSYTGQSYPSTLGYMLCRVGAADSGIVQDAENMQIYPATR